MTNSQNFWLGIPSCHRPLVYPPNRRLSPTPVFPFRFSLPFRRLYLCFRAVTRCLSYCFSQRNRPPQTERDKWLCLCQLNRRNWPTRLRSHKYTTAAATGVLYSDVSQWCKQDQILKTKTKTKITLPRPRPPEVNKGTWRLRGLRARS